MVTVREVTTRKDLKKFVEFPLELYRACQYFVPPLYSDEMKLLGGPVAYRDVSDTALFLAERDGEVVGRIQAIIQHRYNELHGERRVRFTRFDAIDDKEVSRALFGAVEAYGAKKGMTVMCGPLGYSDLDREGLLIEGFDYDSTFEEQYNYEYYASLVEDAGLTKEIDWLEFRIFAPDVPNEMLPRVASRVLEMNGLHLADPKMPKKKYIEKYGDGAFHCIDECYKHLYGTVPFTESMKKELIDQFLLILNNEYLIIVCDKDERVVAMGLCFPAIGEALKKSGGRLTPLALIKLLRLVAKPKTIDLGLIAVLPEYQNSGLNAVLLGKMYDFLAKGGVEYFETNLNLETNKEVMSQWKYFKALQHKRRRAYVKNID